MKSKAQMTKIQQNRRNVLTLRHFDIHLTFACLPQAGILTFEIGIE